jgi:hypothetical protein
MAQIVPSKQAPDFEVGYALPGTKLVEFKLKPGGSYKTDDRGVLAEASTHPWLQVEYDASEAPVYSFRPDTISSGEDALSSENSEAFEPKFVKRDLDGVLGTRDDTGTAIQAGLDQDKKSKIDGINQTLAADAADSNVRDD